MSLDIYYHSLQIMSFLSGFHLLIIFHSICSYVHVHICTIVHVHVQMYITVHVQMVQMYIHAHLQMHIQNYKYIFLQEEVKMWKELSTESQSRNGIHTPSSSEVEVSSSLVVFSNLRVNIH